MGTIKDDDMDGSCNTDVTAEDFVQNYSRKTRREETSWETQAYMKEQY